MCIPLQWVCPGCGYCSLAMCALQAGVNAGGPWLRCFGFCASEIPLAGVYPIFVDTLCMGSAHRATWLTIDGACIRGVQDTLKAKEFLGPDKDSPRCPASYSRMAQAAMSWRAALPLLVCRHVDAVSLLSTPWACYMHAALPPPTQRHCADRDARAWTIRALAKAMRRWAGQGCKAADPTSSDVWEAYRFLVPEWRWLHRRRCVTCC